MNAPGRLLDEVVEASGLTALIAPFTISRLLITAGVTPGELTPETLETALPALERGLAVYLDPDDLQGALERLRALAA